MDFWENVRLVRQNDKRLSTYTQNLTLEFQYKNVCCVVLVFALERIQIREQLLLWGNLAVVYAMSLLQRHCK